MEILVKNIALKSNNVEVGFLYKTGPIYEELKEKNAKITVFNKSNNILNIAKEIKKYCKEQNIDILNVHDGGLKSLLIYYIILKTSKIKMVRTVHSEEIEAVDFFINNKVKKKITYMFMKSTMKLSNKVVCVSKAVESSIKEAFNLKNTVVIYNGIEKKNILTESKKEFNNKILYCGRLAKEKGVDILLNAFKILTEKNNLNLKLTVVGDGEERLELEKKCKNYAINNKVIFEGFQSNVLEFMDNSSIFVYPVIWKEAFGISIVEAMSRGCIPIAFNNGGIPEIITNGKNGFLVDEINERLLADTILKVCEMKEEERNMIIRNAIIVSQEFTIDNTIKRLEEEYKKL